MSEPHTECNEVKRKAHKHAELIKAWADGAEIEWKSRIDSAWFPLDSAGWFPDFEYRIKPIPKPDVVIIQKHAVNSMGTAIWIGIHDLDREEYQKVKWTIDGETGRIKAVELLDK